MGSQNAMQLILIGILLLCGYFYLFQAVAKRTASRSALPMIAAVLLIVYALIAGPLVLIISRLGSVDFILLALLILTACVGAFLMVYDFGKHFREANKGMAALFLLYVLAVGYITVFSRSERRAAEILLRFDSISEAIRRRSLQPLEHLIMNVVLFLPLGVLFPLIQPRRLGKWRYIIPLGLLTSALIEAVQLILRLGQCDIEDLAANTVGACLGLGAFKLYRRWFKGPGSNRQPGDG
ncbi:MAG: VanZ family protein [Clostridia bacterium]|nr:VanZ family protein [Clostridia bacterium]